MASAQRYETIEIEKRGAVDWLTLNRPEALNAINVQMVTELVSLITAQRAYEINSKAML